MRIRLITAAIALLLMPALASAQQDAPTTPTNPRFTAGYADFGVRGTSTKGDAARYERYRDLSDGLFLEALRVSTVWKNMNLAFDGEHVGRKDQRLIGLVERQGKFGGYFMWDQIPMLMSRTTRTFFQGDVLNNNGVLTIDDAIQQQGAANANNIPLLFTDANTQQFELRTDRHIAEGGFQYWVNQALTVNILARNTNKTGGIPYGGSFGHSQLVETVAPIDYGIKDFDADAEYTHGRFLFRGGYTGSFFTNENTTLTFDNPWRAVDSTSGSSRGRSSLPPSNSFFSVNGLVTAKLPWHSRATAYVSGGLLQDAGDPIMPQTVNTALVGINPLPRTTVEGEGKTMATNLSFSSRPKQKLDFVARYRSYDYDNRTPEFVSSQRISYDNSVSNVNPPISTEPFGLTRRSFDVEGRYLPMMGTSIGVGYNWLDEERTHRAYEGVAENTVRVTFDTVNNTWFSLRTKYEHGSRRARGFDPSVLVAVGEQTEMRHADIAPRDRDRVTFVGIFTPITNWAFNGSIAVGNDDYLESIFGIRDNNHRVYAAGADWSPRENVSVGASYSFENYMALSRSRQASDNTPTGCINAYPVGAGQVPCEFYDPARDWAVDTDEHVHSFILYADFLNIKNKWDVRLNFDSNRSTSTYHYITGDVPDRTLPDEVTGVPSTLPTPTQLPDVISNLDRGTLDVVYKFNARLSFGLSYWYERYDVDDFALDVESTGNQARSNAVLLGYMYTPYTAQTVWGRLMVRW